MASVRLTSLYLEKLQPPASGRLDIHDKQVPGLILRVTPTGSMTYSFRYTFRGRTNRLTLGQAPGLTLAMARERAWDARAAIQRGDDPVQQKKDEEREARENGFKSCVEDFIEKYAKPRNKTWEETKRILDRLAVPAWNDRPVKEIRRRDVVELIENVARETPFQANQLRLHLSKLFNWLAVREAIEANPVTGIPPPVDLTPRERFLSDAEIVALWNAAGRLGLPFGPAIRFLLLTGVRREEGACLRWDELDGDWAAMPGSRMKNGRDFRAPLSAAAKAIVGSMPKLGDYVFTTNGRTPISGWGGQRNASTSSCRRSLRRKSRRGGSTTSGEPLPRVSRGSGSAARSSTGFSPTCPRRRT